MHITLYCFSLPMNPFRRSSRSPRSITETLEVATTQKVQVELYDVLGRKLATPFQDLVIAYGPSEFEVDTERLTPGLYILKITGETFSEIRCIDVTR